MIMETTFNQSLAPSITGTISRRSKLSQFIAWCDQQEQHRFGWLAVALAGHGCVLTPLTLLTIVFSGNLFALWIMAIAAMGMTLVVNLAALPTKITLPVFFFSILIDIATVVMAISGVLA
jgi:hypothetical protein